MAPAKSKGPAPSIPSSVSTRHPVLGAQPASHSLDNACSQGERQPFCPKPQPSQGRVLPARDSSQEKKSLQGSATFIQSFPYQHIQNGVKQQHQSYRGRAWQLQDPHRAIPLLGWLSIPNISSTTCFLPFQQEQGASDPLPSCWFLPSLLQAFSTGRGSMHQHGFSHSGALLTTRASECLRTSSVKSHLPRTITRPSHEHCRRERGKMLDTAAAMRESFW